MPKILGIDYGEKKIGIALSDEEQKFAFPKTTQANIWDFFKEYITEIITKENISEIVVGLPLSLKGEETELSRKVMKFVEKLKKHFNIPVHLESEIFTSRQVKSTGGAPLDKIDASAAALILQTYLDKRKNR